MALKTGAIGLYTVGAIAAMACWLFVAFYLQEAVFRRPSRPEVEGHYSDVTQAKASGFFDRIRVAAAIVPGDARDIWEWRTPGTSDTWACFATTAGRGAVKTMIEQLGADRGGWPADLTPRRQWPGVMSPEPHEAYTVFSGGRACLVLGVDQDSRTVCLIRKCRP
jgi:hypothetical protein